jgi:hypothetical protein
MDRRSRGCERRTATRAQGSVRGARCTVSLLATLALVVFVAPSTALAAGPPEAPELTVESVRATEATFHGVVNPKAATFPLEAGTYQFVYRPSTKAEDKCKGAGEILAPLSPGMYFGVEPESFFETPTTLTANTEYAVCLIVEDAEGKTVSAPPVPFTTALPPETPVGVEAEASSESVKLKGVLNPSNPGNPGSYEFVYAQSESECTGGEAAGSATGAATGAKEETVEATITGLLPNTAYTFCLRARNEAGEESALSTPPVTITTLTAAPTVGEQSFSNVGSSSATLSAHVDPGGAPTTFFFEYGPTAAYGSTTPVESAGAGSQPIAVRATLGGLAANTQYHFHVVVTSTAKGTAEGEDVAFSTLPPASLGLPDGRGYELVSPLNNGNNEEALPLYGKFSPIRAAADGSSLAYLATPPAEGGNGHSGSPNPGTGASETNYNEYLARRSPGGGWTAADIQPPSLENAIYGSISSDLSTGVLASPEPLTAGVPGGGYPVLYSRASDGSYRPLSTRTPPHQSANDFSVAYAGISADSRHLLFSADDALLEGAGPQAEELNTAIEQDFEAEAKEYEEANKQEEEGNSTLANLTREVAGKRAPRVLYDNAAGGLNIVDVLPNGEFARTAVFGSEGGAVSDVIAGNGSRIIWTATEAFLVEAEERVVSRPQALYVRENDTQPQSPVSGGQCTVPADACTVQVDASTLPGTVQEKEEKGGHGTFWTASADASRVFFTDELQLTGNATAEVGKPDLYEYEVSGEAGKPGNLTDLTANGTEPANVAGVLGASEDGSYVYFAAAGALAAGAQPQGCSPESSTSTSKCNVYVVHDGGAPTFVAAIAATDGEGGRDNESPIFYTLEAVNHIGDWVPKTGYRSSRVTPDGRHLLFESVENVTGFDSHETHEIYLYDVGSGVMCVSCSRTGAPTLGGERNTINVELPESLNQTYASRDLSSNGNRVFFDTAEALVPQDKNGLTDVYEWERDGSGSCAHENGCLYLLSGGTSGDFSAFLDASESGDDVFLATRAELVPQDQGEEFEIYDARVGAPQPPTPQACTGTGCQGVPPAPPVFATPSSVTFTGAGNFAPPPPSKPLTAAQRRAQKLAKALKACAKDRAKKKRARCQKSARQKYGALKATKASNDRRVR